MGSGDLTGEWHHILITHDGTHNDYTTIPYLHRRFGRQRYNRSYKRRWRDCSYRAHGQLVGVSSTDTRNADGKIAQVGVWSRVLTSTEIANLAAGQAPDLAAAQT